jgi:hypothetical protein
MQLTGRHFVFYEHSFENNYTTEAFWGAYPMHEGCKFLVILTELNMKFCYTPDDTSVKVPAPKLTSFLHFNYHDTIF